MTDDQAQGLSPPDDLIQAVAVPVEPALPELPAVPEAAASPGCAPPLSPIPQPAATRHKTSAKRTAPRPVREDLFGAAMFGITAGEAKDDEAKVDEGKVVEGGKSKHRSSRSSRGRHHNPARNPANARG